MRGLYNKPILALVMLSLLSFADANTLCKLKFFETNTENWADLSSGWMLGLFNDP